MTTICEIKPSFQKIDKRHGALMIIHNGDGAGIDLGKTSLREAKIIRRNNVEIQFININDYHYVEHANYIELCVTVENESDRDEFLESVVDGEAFSVVFIDRDGTMIQVAGVHYNDPVDYFVEADFYD